MTSFSHIDDAGAARMVDVSGKAVTARTASASGRVLVSAAVIALLRGAGVPKGDTLAVARLAGIMGAKQTPSLIPLCHPLALSSVTVDLTVTDDVGRHPRHGRDDRPDRRRDGGPHRRVDRRPHRHRHGQGGRQGRGDHRRARGDQDRRQVGRLEPT